jgi:hypothetical protein
MFCEYCGAMPPDGKSCKDLYDTLAFYTLSRGDVFFIHQLVVDTYGAQHAHGGSKPIAVAFALIGLYLFSQMHYTGREVQKAHMRLGEQKEEYPAFMLPKSRGPLTVVNVLQVPGGDQRDKRIKEWAKSTWEAFINNQPQVVEILTKNSINKV